MQNEDKPLTEIVEREFAAKGAELIHELMRDIDIADRSGFGNFETDFS